jgi:diguanylate cyclase (GGDEF)-like protein
MTNVNLTQQDDNIQKELDRARRELSILYEVSRAMRTTLDLRDILYIILTSVTSHTGLGFNRAILYLVNHITRCLEPKMALGPESLEQAQNIWRYLSRSKHSLDDLIQDNILDKNIGQDALFKTVEPLKIPLSTTKDNLLITAHLEGMPVHIPKDKISGFAQDPFLQVFKTNELVIMPLKIKDQVNGLIVADNLYTQKPISDDDLKIFSMLADHASLAIENSRLYEMTKHKSHTDALTNLWNHGYFQSKLAESLDQAQKADLTLSLLMIDVDDFKKLNDTYGHQNGDIVLKDIANLLIASSREGDYVCRYGGEEFSMILKETNEEQARTIATRIHHKVSEHTFPGFPSDPPVRVTVSIGLALFSKAIDQTKETLISRADKALYAAKHSGKNTTCFAY